MGLAVSDTINNWFFYLQSNYVADTVIQSLFDSNRWCDLGDTYNVWKSVNQLPYSLYHILINFYDIIFVDHVGWIFVGCSFAK